MTQEIDAIERLIRLAKGDTGQARRAAGFLLAWWNADSLGGFDVTDLFAVDERVAADMATVFSWLARQFGAVYPEQYRSDIEEIIREHRPDVWSRSQEPAHV